MDPSAENSIEGAEPIGGAERVIFLTGGAGHTGARAVRRLLAEGWRVRALVRTAGHEARLPSDPRLEIVRGDLTDAARPWLGAMRGADAVLQIANIRFAREIVEACRAAGVERLIAVSSTRRFTRFPDEIADRVRHGEAEIEASGLAWTILRPSMIYGGRRDNNMEKLVAWFGRTRLVPLVGGGRNLVQPIFVDDLVEAMIRTLAQPETTARCALTIAGPEAITLREAMATIGAAVGRRPLWVPVPYGALFAAARGLELLPGRALFRRDQVRRLMEDKAFDTAEAREALGGFVPRSFAEGIRLKMARWDEA